MNKIIVLSTGRAVGALILYLIAESIPNTTFPWPVLLSNAGSFSGKNDFQFIDLLKNKIIGK